MDILISNELIPPDFSDSVIDAEFLFKARTDVNDDSADEIIEAYCEWIREFAIAVKDDMTPKDIFILVLTLVLFGIGLAWNS